MVLAWFMTIKGRPFFGLIFYQLYIGLTLMRVFAHFAWMRIPLLTAILVFLSIYFNKTKKIVFLPQTWLMIALYGVMCLSRFINGLEVFGGQYMVFFYKIIFAHVLIINLVDSKERLKMFLWILVISAGVLAYVARYHDSQTAFFWTSKNGFGRNMVGMIAFAFVFAMSEKKWILKGEGMCYGMLILIAVIGTNSRGAFLGAVVVLCLLLITNFSIKKLVIIAIMVLLVVGKVSDVHWKRYESIDADTEQGGTGGQRIAAWNTAVRMMLANPILGVGADEFGHNFVRYATYDDMVKVGGEIGVTALNTHNMVLQLGSENGFLGFGLFALIIVFCCRDVIRSLKLCRGDPELKDVSQMVKACGIAITGFFVAGLFGNAAYDITFYTFVSLIAACRMIIEKSKKEAKKHTEGHVAIDVIPHKYQLAFRTSLFVTFAYICRMA